jgi:hypothetical protein
LQATIVISYSTSVFHPILLYIINNVAAMGITVSWSGHRGHLGTLPMNRNAPRGWAAASGRFSLFEPSGEFENRMEMSRLQGKVPGVGAKEMVNSTTTLIWNCFYYACNQAYEYSLLLCSGFRRPPE